MPRLKRIDPNRPGLSRIRKGRGFAYVDGSGAAVDAETRDRIRGLAIPPAWQDVWICTDPAGHIQATGIDAAGRKQYRYHDLWRARRDRQKHRRVEGFGASLKRLRRKVSRDLARPGLPREKVLAGAVRLLDRSALRVGGEEYAKQNGSYGLATLRSDHATVDGDTVDLVFDGKSGKAHAVRVRDKGLARLITSMKREDAEELFGWRDDQGWHDVRAADVNAYLRSVIGEDYSAKDFRTWHATVLTAALLSGHDRSEGRRAVTAVVRQVAEQLGNTPAVCRASYIDPRIVDRFLDESRTISGVRGPRATEDAVLELLAEA